MEVKQLTSDLSVAGQLHPDDVRELKQAGYRAILCNRPDGEVVGQPAYAAVKAAAEAEGLDIRQVPIVSSNITAADVAAYRQAMEEMPSPLLAYCRSGTRSTTLWALVSLGDLAPEDILARADAAGYDMSGVVNQVK